MAVKLQKISDIRPTLGFTEYDIFVSYRKSFACSWLGRVHAQLPLKELARAIYSHSNRVHPQGRKPMFPPEGEVGLMFLKMHTGLSDDALIEQLNGNIHMQLFCGVLIDPEHPVKDGKIVSAIRNRLARMIDIKELQRILYDKWAPQLRNKDLCLVDATCYESSLRHPTDVKLLWECCFWVRKLLEKTCREHGERVPRSKYNEVDKARLAYAKQRKRKKGAAQMLRRRLINLLSKLLRQWNKLCKVHASAIVLDEEQHKRLLACRKTLEQQRELINGKDVKNRIVSIDRPYINPIVRGKENKRTEFGAKSNNIQIDGISFIEHISFEAFNEGVRLQESAAYHKELTGVMPALLGGDAIYDTDTNRKFCTENRITTNFARIGLKEEDAKSSAARRVIGNLRATVMEGSFGNQKLHYGLARVAARNQRSEILLIFFGVHTANAATLVAREIAREQKKEREERQKRRRA